MALLSLNNVEVVYDRVFLAVKGVSIEVPEAGLVALLGANGAGKSTILKAVSWLLAPERGEVTRGEITFDGVDVLAAFDRACVQVLVEEHQEKKPELTSGQKAARTRARNRQARQAVTGSSVQKVNSLDKSEAVSE